jgi:hypothetical protein
LTKNIGNYCNEEENEENPSHCEELKLKTREQFSTSYRPFFTSFPSTRFTCSIIDYYFNPYVEPSIKTGPSQLIFKDNIPPHPR